MSHATHIDWINAAMQCGSVDDGFCNPFSFFTFLCPVIKVSPIKKPKRSDNREKCIRGNHTMGAFNEVRHGRLSRRRHPNRWPWWYPGRSSPWSLCPARHWFLPVARPRARSSSRSLTPQQSLPDHWKWSYFQQEIRLPSAITSHFMIPPKMLIKMTFTESSPLRILKASATWIKLKRKKGWESFKPG